MSQRRGSKQERDSAIPASKEADTSGTDIFDLVDYGKTKTMGPINGVVIGRLVELLPDGAALIDYPTNPTRQSLKARSATRLAKDDQGCEVALLFEEGNPSKPVVIGRMHDQKRTTTDGLQPINVAVDGEEITVTGKKQIVLRCGKASITLTRAGKVIVQGAYVLNRSTGINQIQGGSVKIN